MTRLFFIIILNGCTYSHYQDGQITAYGWSFGSNNALEGMMYMKSQEGTQFQIKGLEQNQTDSIKSISEGITKGVISGIKP